MNNNDSVTYKMKKYKKKNKDNISNSSRDSIEKEIRSYDSNVISKKGTSKGEEIKFFFNQTPSQTIEQKTKSKSLFSSRTIRKSKEKDCNFKDILINYINSPQARSKKLNEDKEDRRKSIIYEKPDVVLTLNGDDDSENNSPRSDKNNDSDSKSSSNSNSSILDSFNLNNVRRKSYSKKSESSKDKNNLDNSKESTSFKFDMNNYKDSSNNSDIEDKNSNSGNNIIFENFKNEDNENEYKKKISKELKKMKNSEKNFIIRRESYSNSRPFKNAYTNTNSFTTTTNTHNTQKTQKTNNSSFQSIQLNNKKVKYNYLCWNDLSLQKKLLIKNRSNSVKRIEPFKDENNENLINDKTENMIYKLKHLNISLEKEKSYFYYFRHFANIKEQTNNYTQKSSENLNNDEEKVDITYNEQFFYPNEFYISKKNSLHNKTHISNLFNKLRQHNNKS